MFMRVSCDEAASECRFRPACMTKMSQQFYKSCSSNAYSGIVSVGTHVERCQDWCIRRHGLCGPSETVSRPRIGVLEWKEAHKSQSEWGERA